MAARVAVYLAPEPGSPLDAFARRWLGRDAATGAPVAQPAVPGITPERLWTITASPRHYGFHGTLKAPFTLADGRDRAALDRAIADLAAVRPAFSAGRLEVSALSGFLALTLDHPELSALAAACVTELDQFRRPPGAEELARRRRSPLTPRQDAQLRRYGYPYVLDDFRFHMTLTARLEAPERDAVLGILRELTAGLLAEPLAVDALAVFEQAAPDQPFRETARHPLCG